MDWTYLLEKSGTIKWCIAVNTSLTVMFEPIGTTFVYRVSKQVFIEVKPKLALTPCIPHLMQNNKCMRQSWHVSRQQTLAF